MFTADASYFFTGNVALGINQEQPFFIILGILCGILGSLYIKFQRWIITNKQRFIKVNQGKWYHRFVANHYFYTGIITFVCLNVIFFFKSLLIPDKLIIQNLIDFDQNLANKNLTIHNYD